MVRTILAMLVVVGFAPTLVCQAQDKPDVKAVVEGGNAFAAGLYARLAQEEGNLFFSPSSIRTALAMTYAGAGGDTAKQMASTLHFTLDSAKLHPALAELISQLNHPGTANGSDGKDIAAYDLVVSNALWGQKGFAFKPDFLGLVKARYGAPLGLVDFKSDTEAARKTINDWVAGKTKDKIKDLIAPGILDDLTRLVLTNAIYFKSNWAEKFAKEATAAGPFKLSADKPVTVPMMHRQGRYGYAENDEFQTLEMPYRLNDLSMIVLLPKKVDGLAGLEKMLVGDGLAKCLKGLKSQNVKVTFPKFKCTREFRLDKTLQALGMPDAFNPDKADFSGMTSEDKLFISAVVHKAFVAVDEEGTEAAAATAVVMARAANGHAPSEPKTFTADHPFVFIIKHNKTGAILFMGRVADPRG